MIRKPLLECVPNFSEGRDPAVIREITQEIEQIAGVQLLDVDPGRDTNRTVVTFVGDPEAVVEAAFRAIRKAASLIDLSRHKGEHPRMGATDVCPLIPISHISMEEAVQWAHRLAERVGAELRIPVYMYEAAATRDSRRNLADIRAGEYEALPEKLKQAEWKPDYGPAEFNLRSGATVIGARDFLVAYNVNLNTTSVRRANSVAFDIREKGRVMREGDPVSGRILRDENGQPLRQPGECRGVKAIGWYIEEYGIAQISMNLTKLSETPLHEAFEACRRSAGRRGMRVTGSELVGLIPLKVMLDAGRYYLKQQQRSLGAPEAELIKIAIRSLGLDELRPFDPRQKIIEYRLESPDSGSLLQSSTRQFADQVASEAITPGGGSVAAYVGALAAALGGMVANLSAHKRGWDDRWERFSQAAEESRRLQDDLLRLVDEDTLAFQEVLAAIRLSRSTPEEQAIRQIAIQEATRRATEVPMRVMELASQTFDVLEDMLKEGLPTAGTDAVVGALCARAAVRGAFLNVQINAVGLADKEYAAAVLGKGSELVSRADERERRMLEMVEKRLGG